MRERPDYRQTESYFCGIIYIMAIAGYRNVVRIIAGLLCLLLFFECNQTHKDKTNAAISLQQMDSIYVIANGLISTGDFEKGIVLVRAGIARAAAEKNDSTLSRFYRMAFLYYYYKATPQKDSAQYYKRLSEKYAQLSGNKSLLMQVFFTRAEDFRRSKQPDSAISASNHAMLLAHELKDSIALLELNLNTTLYYRERGNTEEVYKRLSEAMNIYRAIKYKYQPGDTTKDSKRVRYIYTNLLYSLADYFYNQGNIDKSIAYYNELDDMIPEKRKSHNPLIYVGKGACYEKMGLKDSANKYFKMAVEKTDTSWYYNEPRSEAARSYGKLLLAEGRIKEGEIYLLESLHLALKTNSSAAVAESRLAYVDFLIGEKKWRAAKDTLQTVIGAMEFSSEEFKARVYETLHRIFRETGDFSQALHYYVLSENYQNSLNTERVTRTMAEMDAKYQTDKKNQQITLLQKNNRIQELQLLAARRLRLFYILGVSVLMVLFGIFYYYRRALQQRKLERMKNELETKALRAQMKPHFIFNCLNAIQELIVTKDYSRSSQYLAEFSRLLRMVLHMADRNFITLQQEVELCRLYISLESLRLKNSFSYSITIDEKMDAEVILFPTLLAQPFIENAIWHGLSHKKGDKHLSVHFEEIGDRVRCTIVDNGIGRVRSAEIKAAKIGAEHFNSKGIKIAEQRISVLRTGLVKEASIKTEDLYDSTGKDAGTKVVIDIVSF